MYLLRSHNYDSRFTRIACFLRNRPNIVKENKQETPEFLHHFKGEGPSFTRRVSYVQWWTAMVIVTDKDFEHPNLTERGEMSWEISGT